MAKLLTEEEYNALLADAERWREIIKHADMAPASMDGPEYPRLYQIADIWNEESEKSAAQRITERIDREIKARSAT